jgi:hypothetical protein
MYRSDSKRSAKPALHYKTKALENQGLFYADADLFGKQALFDQQ